MSEHDDLQHGSAPLPRIDPADLHAVVDALAQTLHSYVDTAVGVRAEFGAAEADEDPRVLALEARTGSLNAQLYDLLHSRLGLHADLTGMTWDDDEHDDHAAGTTVDSFHLGFLVGPPEAASDLTLDSVLDLVDGGGAQIAARLAEAGFEVVEWGAARGSAVGFEDDDEDDDGSLPEEDA